MVVQTVVSLLRALKDTYLIEIVPAKKFAYIRALSFLESGVLSVVVGKPEPACFFFLRVRALLAQNNSLLFVLQKFATISSV